VVRDPRQGLEQLLLAHALRRQLGRRELQGEAVAHQQDAHRGGARDDLLEARLVGLADGAVARVDEQDRRRAPGGLVLPDHELAAPGHARPVDPAEVVALDVRPHRVELVARPEQVLGQGEAAREPERRVRPAGERLHLRGDHEVLALVELDAELREGERVGQVDRERPERVAPPLARRE
jgi:hypothetical protein